MASTPRNGSSGSPRSRGFVGLCRRGDAAQRRARRVYIGAPNRRSVVRRADRLFQIIQILRSHRRPVTAQALAEELQTSVRTVYRDIADLALQQVPIRGEAGIGYVLERGYDMPPLMLTPDEIEAVVLGAQ